MRKLSALSFDTKCSSVAIDNQGGTFMSQTSMRVGPVPWIVLVLSAVVLAVEPGKRPKKETADPNDPQRTRAIISRAEREGMGLRPHTWTGVVDPEVVSRIDKLNTTVARLQDKMMKEKDVNAFNALWRIQFKGMAYVEVEVADKDSQRRLLAVLKASEFYTRAIFDTQPGLTGYVSKDGVDKLSKHPDVKGVCLDDKPLPITGRSIFKEDIPAPKPGERATTQPGVDEQKVDPDVYRALELQERVEVVVSLKSDSLPRPTEVASEMLTRNDLRARAETKLQDQVLSSVSADDLWVSGKVGPTLSGFITKEGIQKLARHSEVRRIYIQDLSRIPAHAPVGAH